MGFELKILRVIDSMHPSNGGPCQGIRNSIPEQAKSGVHNEVVSLDNPDAAFLGQDSFTIHAIGPSKGPWGYSKNLRPWLSENLTRFDVVIVHGLWQYYGHATQKEFFKLRSSKKALDKEFSPKLFVMPHGMLDPYFQKAPGRKLKAIRNWCYWKLIEQHVIHQADGILFTCEAELILARQTFQPYHPKKELNVGYGVDFPPEQKEEMSTVFYESCPRLPKDVPYLLFLSRIHPKKGVDLLIEAYAKVYKGDSTKLIIAGPGMETAYGLKLKDRVAGDPNISDAVFFPGMLSGDAKWGAFYHCDAFVLPSHQENFGIAIVEALACAKAVLISKQVNIYKEIEEGKAGLIANDTLQSTTELLEQWRQMAAENKVQMAKSAKNLFEHKFTIKAASSLFLEVISKNRK